MKKRILDILFAITHIGFWVSNYPSSKEFDEFINDSIDKDNITILDNYYASISDKTIWIENYPYAFGTLQGSIKILPYRRTRKRLYIYFIKKNLSNIIGD